MQLLLMRMLQDEGRDTLRQHRGLIAEIINQLRAKTAADSEGGADVTRDEMRDVLLSATSRYQTMAVDAIAAELQRDYANMGEATRRHGARARAARAVVGGAVRSDQVRFTNHLTCDRVFVLVHAVTLAGGQPSLHRVLVCVRAERRSKFFQILHSPNIQPRSA